MEIKAKKVRLFMNSINKHVMNSNPIPMTIKRPCNIGCLEIDNKRWKLKNCR